MGADTMAQRRKDVALKLARVREYLQSANLDGVLLTRQFLIGWITAGMEDRILHGDETGFLWALVTADAALIVTSNIEAERLLAEEDPAAFGFEVLSRPWYEGPFGDLVSSVCDPARIGNDGFGPGRDVAADLQRLRLELTDGERVRMRALGLESCAAVEDALRVIRPGTTEAALAGDVARRLETGGIFPFAVLVGADDRRRKFRHPTVRQTPIRRDVLVVLVGVRGGLNVALSRSAAFGSVDPVLAARHLIACEAEARAIQATRPGATYGEAMQAQIDVYEAHGYADEWRQHTQGGTIGYGGREFVPGPLAAPNAYTDFPVAVHHAVAWNPTVQGGKSEDTLLVGETANEMITETPNWPMVTVPVDGGTATRPAILEL
ncbi:MAG: hypothetical protein QOK36_3879 [Gaiellales bacterium]|jgi:Xaa-Pro dipeptidase|nr:hypothetical protein [Gaiellales bacterium]